jgi:hypothetical protein
MILSTTENRRFESHFEKSGRCWLWQKRLDKYGYGRFSFGDPKKSWKVHRLAYTLYVGQIPNGKSVLHHCDVRHCVKPDHLFTGTQTENITDMIEKRRQAWGQKINTCKLIPNEVEHILEMARLGVPQRHLGVAYNVSHRTIGRIVNEESWRMLYGK